MDINTTIKRTKILATIGPATNTPEIIEQIIRAGVNGARLNFSHEAYDWADNHIAWIREASAKVGRHVAIVQDLQGPKIRLGQLKDDMKYEIHDGDEIGLTEGIEHDGGNNLPSQFDFSPDVHEGEAIYLFDGEIKLIVERVEGKTVWTRAKNAGWVISRKSINLPDTNFDQGRILTDKDLEDLKFGADKDIDYLAVSFIHKASDLDYIREKCREFGIDRPLITKLETKLGASPENLEDIVKNSDGVMVARGDLATEAGAEVVPVVERKIIELCQKHCKFSIVATQMMASMVDNPQPTRAEVSDVATAAVLGADCVMLSDETAMGQYPVETVEAMKNVLLYTQNHLPVHPLYVREGSDQMRDAVAESAVMMAQQAKAHAIVVETTTGRMARNIVIHRPEIPVLAVSQSQRVANQMALLYNTLGFTGDGDDYGWTTVQKIREAGFFGDTTEHLKLVVVRRVPSDNGEAKIANTIQLRPLE